MKLSEFKKIIAAWPDHEDAEVWVETAQGISNDVESVVPLNAHDLLLVTGSGGVERSGL